MKYLLAPMGPDGTHRVVLRRGETKKTAHYEVSVFEVIPGGFEPPS